MDDESRKVRIFASDDNLKSLGELLSNETSRKIIRHIMVQEMYTNEIATKLDIRVSLVIHHLKKLEELGLIEITNKKIKRKGEKHRFFKMSSDIFITLDKNKEDVEKQGILKSIFRDGIKFAGIGIAFLVTSSMSIAHFNSNNIRRPVPFGSSSESVLSSNLEIWFYPLIILVIGLIIERILSKIKKKKKRC